MNATGSIVPPSFFDLGAGILPSCLRLWRELGLDTICKRLRPRHAPEKVLPWLGDVSKIKLDDQNDAPSSSLPPSTFLAPFHLYSFSDILDRRAINAQRARGTLHKLETPR